MMRLYRIPLETNVNEFECSGHDGGNEVVWTYVDKRNIDQTVEKTGETEERRTRVRSLLEKIRER